MAVNKVALANRWMSVTDVIDRLRRARENREQQSKLLEGLEGRAKQRRDEVEHSLADLPHSQRSQVVNRAVNGFRSELKRQSLDSRVAYLKTVGALREDVNSARAHYQNPVQMLAREGLGSERRSRLLHQIEKSGQIELASLAALAASTGDKELAAALLTRNSGLPVNDRLSRRRNWPMRSSVTNGGRSIRRLPRSIGSPSRRSTPTASSRPASRTPPAR